MTAVTSSPDQPLTATPEEIARGLAILGEAVTETGSRF